MSDIKKIRLARYSDGTPSVMRKKTVYTDLFFYRKSDVLVQLTKNFCERFLPPYGDRTVDQMVQAARSVKQNIAEGLTDGRTSFETEIKLLGIAVGSNQELLEDYQDYMKRHHIRDWASDAPADASRYRRMLDFCRSHNDLADYEPFFGRWGCEEMCNVAVTLCHIVDRAMSRFLEGRDREFVEEGGIRERMTAARLDRRGSQQEVIARQEAEIAALRARVAELEALLAERQG